MQTIKIVLTGGPCGGKTGAQPFLAERLRSIGYHPIFVPEAATLLMSEGKTPTGGLDALKEFQEAVVDRIMLLEAEAERQALSVQGQKPIILCDRGLMDGQAYMPGAMFQEILRSRGLDMANARDARYHAVFHLRTAAMGAEEFYTLTNNAVRSEKPEEAKALDEATLRSWIGHPHVGVVGNTGRTFEKKLEFLWAKLRSVLGDPVPLEIERKYLVRAVDFSSLPHHAVAEIRQFYIRFPNANVKKSRVRRRGVLGAYTYHETKKQLIRPGVRVEEERMITLDEYERLLTFQAAGTTVIEKRRHCFVHNDQYFELDVFDAPGRHVGLILLEIELTHEEEGVELPPGIDVVRDVTGEKAYMNSRLAKD